MKKRILTLFSILLAAAFFLCACAQSGDQNGASTDNASTNGSPGEEIAVRYTGTGTPRFPEGNARVFYEIFVGSFSDSNGDGVGDLRGIINRMDYLNDGDPTSGKSLGVEGLWLTPIFASPSYHKYNVTDYYRIDSDFGTTDDLKDLLALCHERNVKVILDLPINHTGGIHQWFINFQNAHRDGDTANEFYNYYCFYSAPDRAPAGRTFSQIAGTSDYYECNFSGDMPELDFDNENVRRAVLEIARYYLDLGVDGFRFDAAKYVYLGDNRKSADFWDWYVGELKKIKSDVYTVGEVWDADGITDQYYPYLNCFNFTTSGTSGRIAQCAKGDNVTGYTTYVQNYIDRVVAMREDAMYVPFIANHDTDRAAGYLTVESGCAQMAANIYILCPGSPFIYYGEEIGMRGSRGGANTDANRRLAMVWDDDTVKNPIGSTYKSGRDNTEPVNEQIADENSLLTYYKKLIMIRQANPEIARGAYKSLSVAGNAGGFSATLDGSTVLVFHNPSSSAVTIDLSAYGDYRTLAAFIGTFEGESATKLEGSVLTLGSQCSAVVR